MAEPETLNDRIRREQEACAYNPSPFAYIAGESPVLWCWHYPMQYHFPPTVAPNPEEYNGR